MKYQVTKKQCQARIDNLDNVCDYCGRKLVPLKTVDNSNQPTYWAGCYHGSKTDGHFTWGTKKETFDLAEKMVLDGETYFSHLDKSDYETESAKEYWFQSQVSGICSLLSKVEYLKSHESRFTKEEFFKQW